MFPVCPFCPLGPVSPVWPFWPFGPVSPVCPFCPLGPVSPVCPFWPLGPVGPESASTHFISLPFTDDNTWVCDPTLPDESFNEPDILRLFT